MEIHTNRISSSERRQKKAFRHLVIQISIVLIAGAIAMIGYYSLSKSKKTHTSDNDKIKHHLSKKYPELKSRYDIANIEKILT